MKVIEWISSKIPEPRLCEIAPYELPLPSKEAAARLQAKREAAIAYLGPKWRGYIAPKAEEPELVNVRPLKKSVK